MRSKGEAFTKNHMKQKVGSKKGFSNNGLGRSVTYAIKTLPTKVVKDPNIKDFHQGCFFDIFLKEIHVAID